MDPRVREEVDRVTSQLLRQAHKKFGNKPTSRVEHVADYMDFCSALSSGRGGGRGMYESGETLGLVTSALIPRFQITDLEAREACEWVALREAERRRDDLAALSGLGEEKGEDLDGATADDPLGSRGSLDRLPADLGSDPHNAAEELLDEIAHAADDNLNDPSLAASGEGTDGASGQYAEDGMVLFRQEDAEYLKGSPFVITPGSLEVTRSHLTFLRSDSEAGQGEGEGGGEVADRTENFASYAWAVSGVDTMVWETQDVTKIAFRHYQLRFVALEIFFTDHTVVMFNMHSHDNCKAFYTAVSKTNPPFFQRQHMKPQKVLEAATVHGVGLTEAWVQVLKRPFLHTSHLALSAVPQNLRLLLAPHLTLLPPHSVRSRTSSTSCDSIPSLGGPTTT